MRVMETGHSKISVLIISFNCWEDLNHCIQSLYDTEFPLFEIIVLDNASVDGTAEKIRKKHPSIRYIQNAVNRGHVRAVNQGLRMVRGDRVLLLDADTVVARDSISILSAFLDGHPQVWMVAPKTYNTDGSVQEGNRRFPRAINGIFGRQSWLTRRFPKNRFSERYLARDFANRQNPYPVEQVGACCMLFRKSIVDEIGGWDEEYFGYFVDSDWCKKIQVHGGLIYSVPAATIIHHDQNKDSRKKSPARIIEFQKGAYRFYCKYYTRGILDPRSIAAGGLLFLRAAFLLTLNAAKKPDGAREDPLSK